MLKPINDRVLVKVAQADETTKGGIVIPDTAKEKPQEGEIVAVGDGQLKPDGDRIPMTVKVGDTVLFGKYSGTDIKIDGEEYLIMREDDILGVRTQELAEAT